MVTCAIVGCGVIGPVHAAALRLDRRAHLKWACDPRRERAERLGATRIAVELAEVLSDPQVDLVHLCTPHHLHAEQAVAALAAGKHVLCEKPLAIAPADLRRMVAAVPDGRVAACGFQHRFHPVARRLHQVMAQGDLGRVRRIEVVMACTRDAAYYATDPWRGKWATEGGGLMINQAIHTLDLALYMAAVRPVSVRGMAARVRLPGIEVEDRAECTVALAGGGELAMRAANDGVAGWETSIAIDAERGAVAFGSGLSPERIEVASAALAGELRALAGINLDAAPLPGKSDYGNLHAHLVSDALSAIEAGRPPHVPLAAGAVAPEVVLGLYHSTAHGGAEAPLPLMELDRPRW